MFEPIFAALGPGAALIVMLFLGGVMATPPLIDLAETVAGRYRQLAPAWGRRASEWSEALSAQLRPRRLSAAVASLRAGVRSWRPGR